MKNFYVKYKHLIPLLLYGVVYMTWFAWLEQRHLNHYQIIYMAIDSQIPFCEVFIIPYFLWFAYVPLVLIYLFLKEKDNYYRNCIFLCTGMTVFLLISTLFPNGQLLRPVVMPRDNIFTRMVAALYATDTPTNLWPSIHVFNSLGAHIALASSELGKKKWLRRGSLTLCTLIILATMFLKQHSMFDVLTAFVMATIMYVAVYRYDLVAFLRQHRDSRRVARAERIH